MSVYIELVIFNNFFLDVMLLLSTATLRRRKVRVWRVLLSAAVGCACATVYVLLPTWAKILIRIFLSPIMSLILMTPKGKKASLKLGDFIATTVVFVLLTYFLGGVVYGVSIALGVDIRSYATLGLAAMGVCILIASARLIARKRSTAAKSTCKTILNIRGRQIKVDALCDSGNLLVDDYTGLPVVILSNKVTKSIEGCDIKGFIDVNTVSGEDSMALIEIEEVNVSGKTYKAMGALSHKQFEDFDIILQNSMF